MVEAEGQALGKEMVSMRTIRSVPVTQQMNRCGVRRTRCRPLGGLLALLSVGACDEGQIPSSAFAVRDSAGVEIVESVAPVWPPAPAWHVAADPVLQIGQVDGPEPYQLDRVVGAVRLSDGRIVVADGGSRRIRYYDRSGRHLTDAGGRGGGPGEFGSLSGIYRMPGDSVAGWDVLAKRLSVFDDNGAFGRAVTPDRVTGMSAPLRGVFADGSVVVSPGQSMQALQTLTPGEHRDTVVYLRFASDGAFLDTLAVAPGTESVAYREGTSFGNHSILFGRNHYVTVGGDRFYAGDSDALDVTVSTPDGTRLRIIRRAGPPRAVTPADLEEARRLATESSRRSRQMLAQAAGRPVAEPDLTGLVHRETYPAFNRLLVDVEGHLWVRAYPAPGAEARTWSVFDPAGRWLGDVEMPEKFEVFEIGGDYVLGRWQDELDVNYVRVYPLVKAGGGT